MTLVAERGNGLSFAAASNLGTPLLEELEHPVPIARLTSPRIIMLRIDRMMRIGRNGTQDIEIWQHQRYSDPPALASNEYEGFTAIRQWAKQFYPDGIGGRAAEVYAASQKG